MAAYPAPPSAMKRASTLITVAGEGGLRSRFTVSLPDVGTDTCPCFIGHVIFRRTPCFPRDILSTEYASGVVKRRYEQRLRAESVEGTRRRILDAVYRRLREAPSRPVSLDLVARTAGVARSTIYLIFGSRAGLFDALGHDLFRRAPYARLLEAVEHPDARESLRRGLLAASEMFAVDRDVARALYSMAQLDHDAVGGAVQRQEDQRARGMARLARRLADQGALRPDVSPAAAEDLLWVLTSFDSFDLLHGRGLSVGEVATALTEAAERALLR